MKHILFCILITGILITGCSGRSAKKTVEPAETQVKIETNMGDIVVKLYNETPKHRQNFLKLVRSGLYNGVLFHRVINDFMIQAGDPDSKNAPDTILLGEGSVGYRIPAEFVPKYYHKRGALAAAREGDEDNPKKESDGSQFYIVTGKVFTTEKLFEMAKEKNDLRYQAIYDSLKRSASDELAKVRKSGNKTDQMNLQDKLESKRDEIICKEKAFDFTNEQKKAYTTVGGVPHLDGGYTVFGELVFGWDTVDRIQHVKTDKNDRPVQNVVIIKMFVLPQKK